MASLRNLALGYCILCASAGVIRVFWPQNSFTPVINTVLLLYIVTSALGLLQSADRADWKSGLLPRLSAGTQAMATPDTAAYASALAEESTLQGIVSMLACHGIRAAAVLQNGVCLVTVSGEDARQTADALLRQNAGTLPYLVRTEENAP